MGMATKLSPQQPRWTTKTDLNQLLLNPKSESAREPIVFSKQRSCFKATKKFSFDLVKPTIGWKKQNQASFYWPSNLVMRLLIIRATLMSKTKTLCKLLKSKKKRKKASFTLFTDGSYICSKCQRISNSRKKLCKPNKLLVTTWSSIVFALESNAIQRLPLALCILCVRDGHSWGSQLRRMKDITFPHSHERQHTATLATFRSKDSDFLNSAVLSRCSPTNTTVAIPV